MNIQDLMNIARPSSNCNIPELTELQKAGLQRFKKEYDAFLDKWIVALYESGMSVPQIHANTPTDVCAHQIANAIILDLEHRLITG